MNSRTRVAVLFAAMAFSVAAAPASARSLATANAGLAASTTAAGTASPTAVTSSPAPCSDSKYNLIGPKWKSTLRWSYKSSTTPSYLTTANVLTVLKTSVQQHHPREQRLRPRRHGQRDVELPRHNLARPGRHQGRGRAAPRTATTRSALARLPAGYLALTCVRSVGTSIVEIDIRLATAITGRLRSPAASMRTCSRLLSLTKSATPTAWTMLASSTTVA